MNHLQERAGYSVEVNIIALYYLNKICVSGQAPVTVHSWRALWSTAIIIAQKTWEDVPIRTTGFADILPSMSRVRYVFVVVLIYPCFDSRINLLRPF